MYRLYCPRPEGEVPCSENRRSLVPEPHPHDWLVEALRLSVFPANPQDAIATERWNSLVGSLPESVTRPSQMPDRVIEEGPWANARLQVEGQPGRIDWRTFSGTPAPNGPMVIGGRTESAEPFSELMSRWLDTSCPPVNRIAFGANLILPEAPLETISRQLDSMLPSVTVDPDGTRDFMYRTNRRRESTSEANLQVNRLATWSAMGSIGLEIAIGPGGAMARSTREVYFCRLELDINTVPIHPQTISRDRLPAVFLELLDAAWEIADQGDIP